MPLDRIRSATPEIRQPVVAKEFSDIYISKFSFDFLGVGYQPAFVEFRQYNYDTKEISDNPDTATRFHIKNLWEEAYRSPLVAQAVGQLTVLLSLLYQERMLRDKLSGEDYEGREVDVETLRQVQTTLGVPLDDIKPTVTQTFWAKPQGPNGDPDNIPT